jgi:cell division septal protein FtsQ
VRGRLIGIGALAVVGVLAVYWFALRDGGSAAPAKDPRAVATIGTGSREVAVSADGSVRPLPRGSAGKHLPSLPLSEPPRRGRVAGPALEQVRVLAAAPRRLRPFLAATGVGESGVEVELDNGVELRFGDASQASRKWRAAAAVLADPNVAALEYVDLHVPSRPAVWGAGHPLSPAP